MDNLFNNLKYQSIAEIIENIILIQHNDSPYLEERLGMIERVQSIIIESDQMEVLLSCEQIFGELFMKEEYMNRKEIFEAI